MDLLSKVNNKRIKLWKEGRERVYIDSAKIKLTEDIHLKQREVDFCSLLEKHKDDKEIKRSIIIRPVSEDEFALVMGFKWLAVAKILNLQIACILVKKNVTHIRLRREMGLLNYDFSVPKNTEEIIPLCSVLIPKSFENSEISSFKMEICRDYFVRKGRMDKPITVSPSKKRKGYYILKDDYIRYLIMREFGINNIPIKFLKEEDEKDARTKI
jgi:hypothetical protein